MNSHLWLMPFLPIVLALAVAQGSDAPLEIPGYDPRVQGSAANAAHSRLLTQILGTSSVGHSPEPGFGKPAYRDDAAEFFDGNRVKIAYSRGKKGESALLTWVEEPSTGGQGNPPSESQLDAFIIRVRSHEDKVSVNYELFLQLNDGERRLLRGLDKDRWDELRDKLREKKRFRVGSFEEGAVRPQLAAAGRELLARIRSHLQLERAQRAPAVPKKPSALRK